MLPFEFPLSLIPKSISPVIPYPSNNLPSYPLSRLVPSRHSLLFMCGRALWKGGGLPLMHRKLAKIFPSVVARILRTQRSDWVRVCPLSLKPLTGPQFKRLKLWNCRLCTLFYVRTFLIRTLRLKLTQIKQHAKNVPNLRLRDKAFLLIYIKRKTRNNDRDLYLVTFWLCLNIADMYITALN